MIARSLLSAGALLATWCAQAAPSDDYAYAWQLQTQGDSAAWQVELTPEVYAAVTRADLRDLEVVNAAGEAVPLALRSTPPIAVTSEAQAALPMFSLPPPMPQDKAGGDDFIHMHIERGADGRLRSLDVQSSPSAPAATNNGAAPLRPQSNATPQFTYQRDLILDASAEHGPLASLQILWDSTGEDISAQFSVAASDDLQQWRLVVTSATVLHLEQNGNLLERHGIALRDAPATYLRLRRLDNGPPLKGLRVVARVRVHTNSELPSVQWQAAKLDGSDTRYLSHAFAAAAGNHIVAWRYHLPAPLAASAIRVSLADDNSLARIVALSRERDRRDDDPAAWSQRGTYTAFRLRQGDISADNEEFAVTSASRVSEWRLESATPLEHAPNLVVAYRPDRFVFLAQGSGPFRLVAGSARAQRSDYPIDTALAPLRAKLGNTWEPPLVELGGRITLRGEDALKPAPPAPPARDWRTWMLWAVLVGAAALIGGLALSLLRRPNR